MTESADRRPGFVERVMAEAPKVRPVKALIAVVSAPLFLLGLALGLLFVVGVALYGGAQYGFKVALAQGRALRDRAEVP